MNKPYDTDIILKSIWQCEKQGKTCENPGTITNMARKDGELKIKTLPLRSSKILWINCGKHGLLLTKNQDHTKLANRRIKNLDRTSMVRKITSIKVRGFRCAVKMQNSVLSLLFFYFFIFNPNKSNKTFFHLFIWIWRHFVLISKFGGGSGLFVRSVREFWFNKKKSWVPKISGENHF